MDDKLLSDFLDKEIKELMNFILAKRGKLPYSDLKSFLTQMIIDYLVERRERATQCLDITPDMDEEEKLELLKGALIKIHAPNCTYEAIVEEVLFTENQKKKYIH